MAYLVYSTSEYRDPEQAGTYDIYIPTGGDATNITIGIDSAGVPFERAQGLTAAALFDSNNQQILFQPTNLSKLVAGDSVIVKLAWTVDGEPSQADITVSGRTGDEALPAPVVAGADGPDTFYGSETAYLLQENFGDVFYGGGGADIAYGRSGLDELHGGPGDDFLYGQSGAPGLIPYEGDMLYGDEGNDTLVGGGGGQSGDYLYGGEGNDLLIGSGVSIGDQGDFMYGGPGDDVLRGLDGPDLLDGGSGIDTAGYSTSPAGVVVLLEKADEFGVAGRFVDFAAGGYYLAEGDEDPSFPAAAHSSRDSYVSIENVNGSPFADLVFGSWAGTVAHLGGDDDLFDNYDPSFASDAIYGDDGDDGIWTGNGQDKLFGGRGDDELHGEGGDDLLWGGRGDDMLVGGAGADIFRYASSASGNDTITDFTPGEDKLWISGTVPAAEILAGQQLLDDGTLLLPYAGPAFDLFITLPGLGTELTPADFI